MTHHIPEQILRVALQSLEFVVLLSQDVWLGGYRRAEERAKPQKLNDMKSLQTFQEHHHIAIRHLYGLMDLCQCSYLMQIGRSGILDPRIKLGYDAQQLFVACQ